MSKDAHLQEVKRVYREIMKKALEKALDELDAELKNNSKTS